MGFTSYADIYDPIKVQAIIGQEWLRLAKIFNSGIIKYEPATVEGTLTYEVRETRFQDSVGQALKAGGTISSVGKTQSRKQHPVIWRYGSSDEPDVIKEIEQKDVPMVNAGLAEDIKKAAMQYVDNSAISVIEGTAAALTSNQSDQTSAVITLDSLVYGFSILNEKGFDLQGGAMFGNSAVYWKLVKLGLVAATSNTFGNELQTFVVKQGILPMNVLGMTFTPTDKLAAVSANNYYIYFVGKESLILKGNDVPQVEVAKATVNKKFSTITNFKLKYGMGFNGVSWSVAGKEDVTDTELATSSSWALGAANSADVKLSRVKIKIA